MNKIKTLITLSQFDNEMLTLISKTKQITKSNFIHELITKYILKEEWIVPQIKYEKYKTEEAKKIRKIINELSKKWKIEI